MRLPRRIVIHKRTAFTRDEREGLIQGLSGVDEVDMVEITIDEHLRYVSSVPNKDGGFDKDNFPVRRGTAVVLDEYTALLWCHGVAAALNRASNTTRVRDEFRHHSHSKDMSVERLCRFWAKRFSDSRR